LLLGAGNHHSFLNTWTLLHQWLCETHFEVETRHIIHSCNCMCLSLGSEIFRGWCCCRFYWKTVHCLCCCQPTLARRKGRKEGRKEGFPFDFWHSYYFLVLYFWWFLNSFARNLFLMQLWSMCDMLIILLFLAWIAKFVNLLGGKFCGNWISLKSPGLRELIGNFYFVLGR
jgi:hypothetical protein